jgi:hypothetical protein
LACVLGVCASASIARADTAIVLPHAGDTRLGEQRDEAQKSVLATLREQSFKIRFQTFKAARTSSEVSSECAQVSCAGALLAAAQAELVVAVAVWQGEEAPQVNVTLVDGTGARYPGHATVASDDVAAAARSALLEARSLQLLGPGPWIAVHGEPAGASVWIDGKLMGSLPLRAALSPGDHKLEVQATGYAAKVQPVTIPLEPTATARVQVALSAASHPNMANAPASDRAPALDLTTTHDTPPSYVDPSDEPAETTGSVWNFVLGGALAAGGVALATIEPIQAAAKDGDCANDDCSELYKFGGDSTLKIAAGAVLVAAGVTVMIWQPIQVRAEVDETHALVSARFQL